MSSPSSATAAGSRSSSPSTSDAFHPLDLIATQSDQHSEFLSSLHQLSASGQWDITPDFIVPAKLEDTQMLHLDELIDQHAYDEYVNRYFQPGMGSHFVIVRRPPIPCHTHHLEWPPVTLCLLTPLENL